MVNEHMKTYSASLAIREMKTRVPLGFHLILIRMSVIKKTKKNKYGTDTGKGSEPLLHSYGNGKHLCLWKQVWWFLIKLKLYIYHMAPRTLGQSFTEALAHHCLLYHYLE